MVDDGGVANLDEVGYLTHVDVDQLITSVMRTRS
jgi:hypothetical protein